MPAATPLATDAGADELLHGPNVAKAKAALKEAGYKGEKIVLLDATDQPIVHAQALVTAQHLSKAGLNVQLDANDWGTLVTRRTSKKPIDEGGWNIFHTWTAAPDMLSPALNGPLRGNGDKAWFGWPERPQARSADRRLVQGARSCRAEEARRRYPGRGRIRPKSPTCRPASS